MSQDGVGLIARTGLVLFLILAAAFFRVLVGPSRTRGEIMVLGTLGGLSAGVLIASLISPWLGFDVSALAAALAMVAGWGVSWLFARRIPREAS